MLLSELKEQEQGIIAKIRGRGAFRKRILEMGFVKGKEVLVVKNAPLQDPIQYRIMGYEVSLRRSEAAMIDVVDFENTDAPSGPVIAEQAFRSKTLHVSDRGAGNHINIALVGNPNCGKTTLFNYASNSREHVGNYSGVTVDAKTAEFRLDHTIFHLTDLPGTYSLSAFSPEEVFVRRHLIDTMPDVVINVVDASNLERNLYLTTQLIDLDVKVVVALNMYDELQKRGDTFDYHLLGKMLGVPVIPTVSSRGRGIRELFKQVREMYNDNVPNVRHTHLNYGPEVEESVTHIQKVIKIPENYWLTDKVSSRFLAIKLIEKDKKITSRLDGCANRDEILNTARHETQRLEKEFGDDSETIVTDARYGFIAGALRETYKPAKVTRRQVSEVLDAFLTHKYIGFPLFFVFLWAMFQATFSLAEYPMEWIERGVAQLGEIIRVYMPAGPLKDLLIDGIIGGVGGVIVFLPNIVILFGFISFMEDTGYMARAAFIMDKVMHKIGLHGKSFIPLLMGFGCNVPAIMATRTIENRHSRLITMLINPFMSCSARLPVYILFIGAFFAEHQGLVLLAIYATGILLAALFAVLLKRTFFRVDEVPFVMELPPYRLPTMRSIIKHMWFKASQYLKKMGGVILIASILIWALSYFPRPVTGSTDIQNHHLEDTYMGRLGKAIEPVVEPLGFDWRMGVSLLSGVAAKEIVVSTMGVIFSGEDGQSENLSVRISESEWLDGDKKGSPLITPLVAFCFMLFTLIYFPCIATVAAIRYESGSWRWALFAMGYSTVLAWLVTFAVYQIGQLI